MKTYTVPIFLGVRAETPEEAQQEALSFMEYAIDIQGDEDVFPYSSIGRVDEIVEQIP